MEKMEGEDQRESTGGDARKEDNEHQPFKKQRLKELKRCHPATGPPVLSDGKGKKGEPWTGEDDEVLVSLLREMRRENNPSNSNMSLSEGRKIMEQLQVCGGGANTMF
jgi:hypothetical protein